MYFLASLDLILVSASCSSGDWKKEHKTASATERHTHVHTHRAQRHAHLPTKQMISYECVQEHVKSVYSAHFNTHAHFYLNSENIHNFLRCCVSMQGCCHVWPWLGEFTGALSSHFTLSRSTIFRDRSLIKLETHSTQCPRQFFINIGQEICEYVHRPHKSYDCLVFDPALSRIKSASDNVQCVV